MLVENRPSITAADLSREKVKRLFEFLRALEERKNPVPLRVSDHKWHFSLAHLPSHPLIRCFRGGQEHDSETVYLKVTRPKLTKAPAPPEVLLDWLSPTWERWGAELEYLETRTLAGDNGDLKDVRFEESDDRIAAYCDYLDIRNSWTETEEPVRLTNDVYEKLFELWGQLRRDSESLELVLGNAVLSLKKPKASIQHPLLLAPVQLVFDSRIPEFRIIDAGGTSEFYHMLFRSLPEWVGGLQSDLRAEFERLPVHPFDSLDEVAAWAKKTVHFLDKNGTVGEILPVNPGETAELTEHPYLLLRSRGQGFAAVLDAIVRDVSSGDKALSPSLLSILGLGSGSNTDSTSLLPETSSGLSLRETDVLFCLPANPQQEKVANAIERQSGVVVQGPPGTGKTHTIANLVGHFLAQGKSVLVTSHTAKALRVLRDKIPEEIRSLCVSVLDDDSKSREELKFAVNKIVGNLSLSQSSGALAVVERCKTARSARVQELADIRNELRLARADEYRPVTVAGRELCPSAAAREVALGATKHTWIRGPITPGAPLPLSNHEIQELYFTNRLRPEDEAELQHWLPSTSALPGPEHFASICRELEDIAGRPQPSATFWRIQGESECDLDELRNLIQSATKALSPHDDNWLIRVIYDSQEELSATPWIRLVDSARAFVHSCLAFREIDASRGPALSTEEDLEAQIKLLEEIEAHLEQGKSLSGFLAGFLHREWTKYLETVTVNERRPNSKADIGALKEKAHLICKQKSLAVRWRRQVTAIGGPDPESFEGPPESGYRQWIDIIESALTWREKKWGPLERKMRELGICWSECLALVPPVTRDCGVLTRSVIALREHVLPEIASRIRSLRKSEFTLELSTAENILEEKSASSSDSPCLTALAFSLIRREPANYHCAYEKLVYLQQQTRVFQLRKELLSTVDAVAPNWGNDIRARAGVHGGRELPGDVEAAWLWRQYHEELERRAQRSLFELQNQIALKVKEVELATSDLIKSASWSRQRERMLLRPEARQALHFWMDVLRGASGNGQRAKYLRSEVRKQMGKCRESVPVWIMPLARLVQNFNPCESKFDVVIIDESSQSDLMGPMAAYMAEKVIVVGDDEQVSPDGIGEQLADIQDLINAYLEDVPGSKLFDRKYSLYDLAKANFGSPIRLREHFRCAPEIIQFSNALSYDFEIQPLRDMSTCTIRPHVVPYKVDGVRANGKINVEEAEAIASLISAMCEMTEYAKASIGVISLLGDEQARYIEKILSQRIPTEEYDHRRIVCGNAYQFQGDQRNVILLSMVESPGDGPARLLSS